MLLTRSYLWLDDVSLAVQPVLCAHRSIASARLSRRTDVEVEAVQGGGTPLQSVPRAATAVKNFYNGIAYISRLYVLSLKFRLTLTNLTVYIKEI